MRIGSHTLGEFPSPTVPIDCERCGRAGSYRRDGLVARFGADIALPDLLVEDTNQTPTSKFIEVPHSLAFLASASFLTFCTTSESSSSARRQAGTATIIPERRGNEPSASDSAQSTKKKAALRRHLGTSIRRVKAALRIDEDVPHLE